VIGRRSLLDLLNTQNTLYNSRILLETARSSVSFAEYRIVAAMGNLVSSLGLSPPSASVPYGRESSGVPPTPSEESLERYDPPPPPGPEDGFFDKL
jgi:adhesin transport system outer membrane protein